jgi:hypothetical protein
LLNRFGPFSLVLLEPYEILQNLKGWLLTCFEWSWVSSEVLWSFASIYRFLCGTRQLACLVCCLLRLDHVGMTKAWQRRFMIYLIAVWGKHCSFALDDDAYLRLDQATRPSFLSSPNFRTS